jgi:hypothetical protein
MSYILSTLRASTPERHQLAVKGLRDGTFTITIAYRTDSEIRALVKNGDGIEYGVNLSDHGNFCSCKDALYRGTVCKHQIALCVYVLQQSEQAQDRVHLMFPDGTAVLCGEQKPRRIWQRWTMNALAWNDLVCQPCVHAWLNPAGGATQSKEEHFALLADERQRQEG